MRVEGEVEPVVERVVVVGAGIAGLAAAHALHRAGVDCVVVEARDRIGGRLHTVDLAGTPVDLGGSWIHHPVGNPVRELAERFGVDCVPADPLPGIVGYDCGAGRRLSGEEMDRCLRVLFDEFPAAVQRRQDEQAGDAAAGADGGADGGADLAMADVIEAYLADLSLPPIHHRQLRQALRSEIECESADLTERQSLRWLWNEFEYDGGYFGDVPVGGYRAVVDPLAQGLTIRLGFDVDEIAVVDDAVRVTSVQGQVETGSHVVVTVPLGVLKDGRPRFDPPLPDGHRAAIGRLGFGRFEKVILAFAEPFWRDAQMPHLLLLPPDPDEGAIWVFDLEAGGEHPTLTAMVPHSTAHHLVEATTGEAVGWFVDLLGQALGHPCPAPLASAVTGWANDRYSLGSYSHLPPGASPDDADVFAEPVLDRVLFAGEHTQSRRLVYTDGAFDSGLRAANRLLGTPAG